MGEHYRDTVLVGSKRLAEEDRGGGFVGHNTSHPHRPRIRHSPDDGASARSGKDHTLRAQKASGTGRAVPLAAEDAGVKKKEVPAMKNAIRPQL